MILHTVPGGGASLLIPFSMASVKDSAQASLLMENIFNAMLQPTLATTSVRQGTQELPTAHALEQNYPNPFNPTTTLRFELLGADAEYDVSLEIYNELGQLITTLVQGTVPRGSHQISFDGSALPSGVYFSRLRVSGQTGGTPAQLVRRMLLLR